MKKLILIGALVATSSSYALEVNGAEILEHHSWLSSPDNKITIIAGHIENNSNIYFSSASTSARADNARGAVILAHKTEVTGADNQGRAVSGQMKTAFLLFNKNIR